MPNDFFRFKQFTIKQRHCAMKVCTDSCILGAWTAIRLKNAHEVLDIGSGTGLLALMLAQKSNARIEGIEYDAEAFAVSTENISQSDWADRIQLFNGDIREFTFPHPFDFIISNPPFFESDLRSPKQKKNNAKHSDTLSLEELIRSIRTSLKQSGSFSLLLPFHRTDYFENLASVNGFYLQEKIIIRQTVAHQIFRSILLFSYHKAESILQEELVIKESAGKYSTAFIELMKDYYEERAFSA